MLYELRPGPARTGLDRVRRVGLYYAESRVRSTNRGERAHALPRQTRLEIDGRNFGTQTGKSG